MTLALASLVMHHPLTDAAARRPESETTMTTTKTVEGYSIRCTDTVTGAVTINGGVYATRQSAESGALAAKRVDAIGPDAEPDRYTYDVVEYTKAEPAAPTGARPLLSMTGDELDAMLSGR